MTAPEAPKEPLQFDSAEPAAGASPALPACQSCRTTLTDTYHTLNKVILCEACRRRLEAEWTGGSTSQRAMTALAWGVGGALVGSAIYYAVLALTGMEIGLIAIVVGWLVGKGVQRGAGGRGGWVFQTMAIALTYLAIVSTYIPIINREIDQPLGIIATVLLAVMLPFLAGIKNIIGLLIIGFALFEAWKLNQRPEMVFAGPFQVRTATA